LIDLEGRVIGINSAITGGTRFVGYGFAVPSNLAQRVVEDLLEYGYVRRPRLGVQISDVTAVDAEAYGLDQVSGAEVNTVT
jgi:serine protease Do